jgi:predicted acylesterase/phospholipase RssA
LLRRDDERPLGIVLSGGGARGAFQAGVWKTLMTAPNGMRDLPDVVSGTSAGAITAFLIAAGKDPDQIIQFWLDLCDDPPVHANEAFFTALRKVLRRIVMEEPARSLRQRVRDARRGARSLRRHRWYARSGLEATALEWLLTARFDAVSRMLDEIHTTHLFDTSRFRQRLIDAAGGRELVRPKVKVAINCVEARTGQIVRICSHAPLARTKGSKKNYRHEPRISVDMVLASASIPLLFNPVEVDDMVLWDGGLLVNSPMAPAVALGARRIIPVMVTAVTKDRVAPLESMGECIERVADVLLENAYNVDRKLMLERNELAGRMPEKSLKRVELFRPVRPAASALFNAGSYLYFERRVLERMYEAGKASASEWLAEGPALDVGLGSGEDAAAAE